MRPPEEIRISADRRTLTLSQRGAAPLVLTAAALRAACRCASCRRAGIPAALDVALARVEPMGGNAVNIVFSDGHDRGVFPWTLLWSLADQVLPTPAEAAA